MSGFCFRWYVCVSAIVVKLFRNDFGSQEATPASNAISVANRFYS